MKQIIQNFKTGELKVEDVPTPLVMQGMVLVKNAFSLISAGTERASIEIARKNLIEKARSRPEDFKKILNLAKKQGLWNAYKTAMDRLETPTPLGYSSAGIVAEVGDSVQEIKAGDRVACAGAGYATHSEVILVPENLCAKVPDNVPLEWAAFTTLGAIALQGIRQADIRVGEIVAVIGLGLLGQLTVQILKASGCRVIGLDIDEEKIKLAKECGADFAFNTHSSNLASDILHLTSDFGVDSIIITAATESNEPFLLAPEIARDRARIVLVGVAKLDFPREPYYRKELSVILSRSYGPGRYDPGYEEKGIDYPIGYVRWTEKRNMEAALQLMSEKKLDIEPLISHKFKIDDVQKAYDMILGKTKERFLGVLFEYDIEKKYAEKNIFVSQKLSVSSVPRLPGTSINVGFIGVGNFARSCLLPNLNYEDVSLIGVADIQGALAKSVANKYDFKYCTSDYKELIDDKNINTIFIATRHNLHAQLIIESLKAGKNVFCEKPLCLNQEELKAIIEEYKGSNEERKKGRVEDTGKGSNEETKKGRAEASTHRFLAFPILMIGFNRRFAPLTIKAKEFLGKKIGPYVINYRVNAGVLPKGHWLLDPEIGGGRIIGEVCHFVDLIGYFVQSRLKSVFAQQLGNSKDDAVITLYYQDGSIGTISYFAIGDKDFSKERIEIFGDNKVCVIDDFRELSLSSGGDIKKIKKSQDKGYRNEIVAFYDAIKNGTLSPILFENIVITTTTTFAIAEAISTGKIVNIPHM